MSIDICVNKWHNMHISSQLPLVSITVITYNSSKTVIETLESIRRQTYSNIELIISDDASTDNTVEMCMNWIEDNGQRFIRKQLIFSSHNTGVSANFNRALRACKGVWVKSVAGDDILFDDCIESYIHFVNTDSAAKFVFSQIHAFGANKEVNDYWNNNVFDYELIKKPNKVQLERLLFKENYIPAVTFFFNRMEMSRVGVMCDERIPLLEDYPLWINLLNKGVRFSFLDKETVFYRISDSSLSTGPASEMFRKSKSLFFIYYLFWPRFLKNPSFFLLKEYYHARLYVEKKDFPTLFYFFLREIVRMTKTR